MGIVVHFGSQILQELKNFPRPDLDKINAFVQHVRQFGFDGLPGRNKCSEEVPKDTLDWLVKVRYAQTHNLWHYHIAIPHYESNGVLGDHTSQYILHYVKGDGFIKIVDFNQHPPFELPTERYLE